MSELPDVYTDQARDTDSEDKILEQMRKKTEKAKKIYGAPTLQLREGMLSIFIRPDAS